MNERVHYSTCPRHNQCNINMFKSYRENVAHLLLLLAYCYAEAIEGVAGMKGVAQSTS